MNGLGYLPDAPDTRDLPWRAAPMAIPGAKTLRSAVISVFNQGGLGSCVAQAGMQAIRIRHVLQGVQAPVLGSRLFGYYMARAVDHTTKYDAGTHLRSLFYAISKFGFPDEKLWPYDDRNGGDMKAPFRRHPSSAAMMGAFDRASPTVYRRIASGSSAWMEIKSAIAAGFPVAFGVDVGLGFVSDSFADDHVHRPPASSEIAGGHAMCAVGYTDSHIEVVNSWGRSWGDGGFCYFSRSYIEQARDLWVVEHAPIDGET
jgi:C1A family cysteine protease